MIISGIMADWAYSTSTKSADLFIKVKNLAYSQFTDAVDYATFMNEAASINDADYILIATPDYYINSNIIDIFIKKYIPNEKVYAVSMKFRDMMTDEVVSKPIIWNCNILKNSKFKNEINCMDTFHNEMKKAGFMIFEIDHIIGRIDYCSDIESSYFYHKNLALNHRINFGTKFVKNNLLKYKFSFKENKDRVRYAAYIGYKDGVTEKNKKSANFNYFKANIADKILLKIKSDLKEE
jgi:hypothetical protein